MSMKPTQADAYKLFHDGVLALARAQEHGMRIDVAYCEDQKRRLTRRIERYRERFKDSQLYIDWQKTYGVKTNMDSSAQLAHMLYNVAKIKPVKLTKGGRGSTDEESLSLLNIPEIKLLVSMKKLTKVRDTYIDAFLREQVNGRLHPFFNLHTTKTYRSCVAKGTTVYVPCFQQDPLNTFETKPIERVRKGDVVWCADHVKQEGILFVCREVLWAGKTGHRNILEMTFVNRSTMEEKVLRVTPEHKIMRDNGIVDQRNLTRFRWRKAEDLKIGDLVLGSSLVTQPHKEHSLCIDAVVSFETKMFQVPYTLVSVKEVEEKVDVYDLEVEGLHNFIAEGLVVHNSSERINFQNIPKRDKQAMKVTREAIYPSKGFQLMETDFSSMEVRLSCAYNNDPQLKKYVLNPTTDMHGDMAEQIFMLPKIDASIPSHQILRQAAKNGFVFPQFYGDYYVNCAENAGHKWGKLPKRRWKPTDGIELDNGLHLAEHLMSKGLSRYQDFEDHMRSIEKDFWGRRFRVYQDWKDKWWQMYQRNGYIELLTGFKRTGIMSRNECINTPIQGTAFHCLLWSFIQIDKIAREENWRTRLIGQIHDSMVFDVHPDELDYVKKVVHQVSCVDIRKHWPWINVPLEIDIDLYPVDGAWYEKKGG